MTQTSDDILDAALMHVPFDGWSDATFRAALADTNTDPVVGTSLFPRGALDLAIAYHKRGDMQMLARISDANLDDMRFRDRVIFAVRARLETVEDRELVQRGTTLFALPTHAAEGARLIWGTADAIWTALGDTSRDGNWYTKRASLSAVYSATVLFWLGDDSLDHERTWAFLDRRIENVMQFEKFKAQARKTPLLGPLMAVPDALLSRLRAPGQSDPDLPGTQSE